MNTERFALFVHSMTREDAALSNQRRSSTSDQTTNLSLSISSDERQWQCNDVLDKLTTIERLADGDEPWWLKENELTICFDGPEESTALFNEIVEDDERFDSSGVVALPFASSVAQPDDSDRKRSKHRVVTADRSLPSPTEEIGASISRTKIEVETN